MKQKPAAKDFVQNNISSPHFHEDLNLTAKKTAPVTDEGSEYSSSHSQRQANPCQVQFNTRVQDKVNTKKKWHDELATLKQEVGLLQKAADEAELKPTQQRSMSPDEETMLNHLQAQLEHQRSQMAVQKSQNLEMSNHNKELVLLIRQRDQ